MLACLFRGNLPFSSLRPVGWYYAIPQVGAVLFAAGWWSALCDGVSRAGGKLTVRGALGVVLLVLVLCGIQGDRAERLHIEAAPPLAPSESGMFWSAYMRNARATYLNAESSEHLRRTLARLDRAEQIALREGIGKAAIRRVFGRVLVPGIPEKHASDAASLLRIPEDETNQSPTLVKKALGNWYREEPETRPPWLNWSEPWPPAPGDK